MHASPKKVAPEAIPSPAAADAPAEGGEEGGAPVIKVELDAAVKARVRSIEANRSSLLKLCSCFVHREFPEMTEAALEAVDMLRCACSPRVFCCWPFAHGRLSLSCPCTAVTKSDLARLYDSFNVIDYE